jgi:hypothetical protein
MDSLPCPRCGYLCDILTGAWKRAAVCPHCRKRFKIKTYRVPIPWSQLLARFWPTILLLAVALVLAAPAVLAIVQKDGDVGQALHSGPDCDSVRYKLYGAVAAVAVGAFWLTRRREPVEEWNFDQY